jgi:hypothetical protein
LCVRVKKFRYRNFYNHPAKTYYNMAHKNMMLTGSSYRKKSPTKKQSNQSSRKKRENKVCVGYSIYYIKDGAVSISTFKKFKEKEPPLL